MGAGQFCTKPGLVFVPAGTGFAAELAEASKDKPTAAMLTAPHRRGLPGRPAQRGFAAGRGRSSAAPWTRTQPATAPRPWSSPPSAANVLERPDELLEECFGPTTLLIEYADQEELSAVLAKVPGSLTATVHAPAGRGRR